MLDFQTPAAAALGSDVGHSASNSASHSTVRFERRRSDNNTSAGTATPAGTHLAPAATSAAALAYWLTLSLDHVGRGMLLVTQGGHVLHANRLARSLLTGTGNTGCALQLRDGRLQASNARENKLLAEAISDALHKGLRRMLTLGRSQRAATNDGGVVEAGGGLFTLAVLPIHSGAPGPSGTPGGDSPAVLISLPQPSRKQDLAVQCWARQQGLTEAETAVLEALLEGHAPPAIARDKKVKLCTVRSHIGKLRAKTESHTIRELLDRVAALPPMMVVVQ